MLLIVSAVAANASSEELVIGKLTLVEATSEIPYAYWYYVPETAFERDVVGLIWHATAGDSQPDDPVFWARFDLGTFLACSSGILGPRVNLPELHGMVLFSIAVPEPLPAFYEEHAGEALGTPVALSSLLTFRAFNVDSRFLDPDLKALSTIAHLKQQLDKADIDYDPRLFITGVYSGAEWAHRFTLLHPTEVRGVAPVCGNWYTLPYTELGNEPLQWPLGLANFEAIERGAFDIESFARVPYYVTASSHELVWYSEITPEEQGIDMPLLQRYADYFGLIPPERGESFAQQWLDAGYPFQIAWSEGGHGWIDPVRIRVFEFFAKFLLEKPGSEDD